MCARGELTAKHAASTLTGIWGHMLVAKCTVPSLKRLSGDAARQGRAGQGWAGLGRAGQGRAGQGRAGQVRAGQGRAGQGRAGQGRAGQGRTGQGRAEVMCDPSLLLHSTLCIYLMLMQQWQEFSGPCFQLNSSTVSARYAGSLAPGQVYTTWLQK